MKKAIVTTQKGCVTNSEVEVTFPCYSQQILDTLSIYNKLDVDDGEKLFLRSIEIGQEWSGEKFVKLSLHELQSNDLGRDGDYYLGIGEFESSEAGWNRAIDMATKMMRRFV